MSILLILFIVGIVLFFVKISQNNKDVNITDPFGYAYVEVNLSPKQVAILHKIGYTNKQIVENDRDFLLREIGQYFKDNPRKKTATKNSNDKLIVCLTGFDKEEYSVLEELCNKANFKLVKRVTKNCNLLVCGFNAGPSKVELAEEFGIKMIGEEEFRKFAEENIK